MNGLPFRPLSRDAVLRLTSHAWRGNVRELENMIHRAVLLADGTEIGIEAIELGPPAASRQGADRRAASPRWSGAGWKRSSVT